ncbi:MAG: VOC family protein [Acidimicrobiales bacterium]|nr:VOC family protein [Acidimicrobiales bacterium]
MARIGGDDVAGIGPQQAPGPPYWTTYITVDRADDYSAKVEAAGGTTVVPAFDVLTAGRMAVFADPNGAFFSVWEPKDSIGSYRVNEVGTLCWNELNTRNLDTAKKFYGEVFGWGWEGTDDYAQFTVGGKTAGGAMPMPAAVPAEVPEHWLVYFSVADINAAAAKIKELGGTTMMDPFPATGVGTMVVAMDPQGAVFAVIQLDQADD